ncbi:Ig-like domain-containing protein, partial [Aeromonas salmonicida]|uniref:Ig-like domain-containing protein n=1 Tax=Aeromonas salmonicida TaxID=645 RepID=UPI00279651D9
MLKRLYFWLPLWGVLTVICFLSACNHDKDDTSTLPPKGQLEALLPEGQKSLSISLAAGLTAKPAIIAAYKGGTSTTIHATELTFTSQDPSIAKTMPTGEIIAVAPGITTIRVSHGPTGVQAHIQVAVTDAVLTSVRVKPEQLTVVTGLRYPLTVEGDLSDGTTVTLPSTGMSWQSNDSAVAIVDEQGGVTGTGAGNAIVKATLNNKGLVATLNVTVEAASIERLDVTPNTLTLEAGLSSPSLRATVFLSNGQSMSVPASLLAWRSTNDAIATVDARHGKVTAVAAGNASVVASLKSAPSQQASVAVQVNATPVAQLQIAPANVRLLVGLQTTLSASAVLSDGREIELAPGSLRWHSSDNNKAIVDELDGRVTGLAAGEVTIAATLITDPSQQAQAVLKVNGATIDALTPKEGQITLVPLTLLEQELQVSALLSDGDMLALPSAAIQWRSSDNQIAVVNDKGIVTGVASGQVTLTATLRDARVQERRAALVAHVQATVTDEQLQQFTLTPGAMRVSDGLATLLQVSAVLSSGRIEQVTADKVTWSSDAPTHASIDTHGMVTGHQPGDAHITAVLNDYPDHRLSAQITVDDAEVSQIITADQNLTIATGLSKSASASAILSNGRTVALPHPLLRWTTSDSTRASVNEHGMVTGLAEGNVTLTATLKRDPTKQATVQVTVLPATITQLVVTPFSLHIVDGLTRALNAHVVLSDGQTVAI